LDLTGERTLLQETVGRVAEMIPDERIFIVAPPEHRPLIHEQLPELSADHVVVEPYPRGNAAAIGLAMAALHAFDPDAVVAVLPSDHVIEKAAAFRKVLIAATAAAEAGFLVTLGITPTGPDTGFGYIEAGEPIDLPGAPLPVHRVRRFIEKPKVDVAERMIAAGGHYWNAGMFVWRVSTVIEAFRAHLPGTARAIDALSEAIGSPRYEQVLAEVWEETERTTIDYGIAEKAPNVAVVPADIGWQDVGSWARLAEIVRKSDNWSADEHISHDSLGNYIYAPGKVVATVGVEGMIIVDAGDVLLVARADRADEVKELVDRLERERREELL